MNYRIKSFQEYQEKYALSVNQPESFWAQIAENFLWKKQWSKVLDWDFESPKVEWFKGAKLNITENLLDRHLEKQGNKTAIIWEPNNPDEDFQKITYNDLHKRVCEYANVLKKHGAKKGDKIAIYMPMIPDLTIAVLACARIGAVHSVVFAGFSAQALADRINDSSCKMVLTSDAMYRGAKEIPVKAIVDEALETCPSVETVIVSQRVGADVTMQAGRDLWISNELDTVGNECEAEEMDAEDMLFILYTSGSTGKPKGVVHTCGGYMVYSAYSFDNVFQVDENDIYWCTADVGWITGHSYIIYGPLLNGATSLMFEGVPTYPNPGRFWQICDKHQVNQFYTAPTAIRALMACDSSFVSSANLTSLKILGSVGEPINKEAWDWYNLNIGKEKCPIVDTWWQTETGGIMISGLGNLSPMKAAHAGYPLPGIQTVLLDQAGNEFEEPNVEGYLAIKFPWPSMLRSIYGDHERCQTTYFLHYKGYYFTGDGAKRDENGMYRIIGRVDDVINVSGHRFGTAEIENAINSLEDKIAESAVVGYPHSIKGQAIYAYITPVSEEFNEEELRSEILDAVIKGIGKIAKPEKIQFVPGLPKTRSGKIMRRILRKIAEGDTSNLGDISTLLNPEVVQEIIDEASKKQKD